MTWSGRYLCRLLGRNPGRSLLSLLLAALLAFAFGLLTVLRGIYGELYQQVEVKPVVSGIGYERARKIENSGLVRDPYYETRSQDSQIELEDAPVYLVNRLDRLVHDPVEWAEGWDEAAFGSTQRLVCVMYAPYAEVLGVGLGDKVRVNEKAWLTNLSQNGDPFEPGETLEELRDRLLAHNRADVEGLVFLTPLLLVPEHALAAQRLQNSHELPCADVERLCKLADIADARPGLGLPQRHDHPLAEGAVAVGGHSPVELVCQIPAEGAQENGVAQKLLPVLLQMDGEGIDLRLRLHKEGGELRVQQLEVAEDLHLVIGRLQDDGGFLVRHIVQQNRALDDKLQILAGREGIGQQLAG